MEMMTVGMALDYIDEYNEIHNPKENNKSKTRQAEQSDFDSF